MSCSVPFTRMRRVAPGSKVADLSLRNFRLPCHRVPAGVASSFKTGEVLAPGRCSSRPRVISITQVLSLCLHSMPVSAPTSETKLYARALPSGGYVTIVAHRVRTLFGSEKIRGEIIVERRHEARREGHRAPVTACAEHARLRD